MNPTNPETTASARSATILRRALTANAVFSGICGLLCVTASASIAGVTGIARAEVFSLGINLEVFCALLIVLATRKDFSRRWVRALLMAVIAMDVLWVVGSAALLLAPAAPLTAAGRWIVFAVALVVADVAYFQLRGFLGLRRAAAIRATP